MKLNIEDFLRGATAVAQGTLAGKLQARQAAEAHRQQEVQTNLALQQAGQQQDDSYFQQDEANDNHLIQNVMPKLTPKSQQEMLRQIEQRRMSRQQRRQQSQAQRQAILPPWMQPYFMPPGGTHGAVPVNPTQPQTNMGPGSTPIDQSTAGVMPGSQNNVQFPTAPATPPPGAFAPPSPLQGPLAPVQAMGMPTPEQMGQPPLAPPQAPSAVPPAPGGVTPATSPAPGGAAVPNPRMVSFPGYEGQFEFKGITPEQTKQFQADRKKAQDFVGSYVGDPTVRQSLDQLYDQLPLSVDTEEDLEKSQRLLRQIESYRTSGAASAFTFDAARYNEGVTARDRARDAIKDPNTSKGRGLALLKTALAREGDLAKNFPTKFDPNSEGLWSSFPDLKAAYDKAKTTPDAKDDNQVLEEMATRLQNDEDERSAAASTHGALQIINNLTSRERRDPKIVAKHLRAAGFNTYAARVEKEGLQFGGYRAERQADDFMKQADNWATMGPKERDLWAERMRDLAEAAGWDQETIHKIVAPKLSPKEMTPYQQKMLNLADQKIGIQRDQLTLARRRLDLAREKMQAAGKKKDGASAAVVLRGSQHELDVLRKAYYDLKKTYGLMDSQVRSGTTPAARDAQALQTQIDAKYRVWAKLYRTVTGFDPDSGDKVTPEAGAPGSNSLTPPPPGKKMSPQERANWQQRLAGMSTEDKLRLLGTRTRKQ